MGYFDSILYLHFKRNNVANLKNSRWPILGGNTSPDLYDISNTPHPIVEKFYVVPPPKDLSSPLSDLTARLPLQD